MSPHTVSRLAATLAAVAAAGAVAAAAILIPGRAIAPREFGQDTAATPRSTTTKLATPEEILADGCGFEHGPGVLPNGDSGYSNRTVGFALRFDDEVNPYSLMSAFVLPGDTLELVAVLTDRDGDFAAAAEAGDLERTGAESWRWTAPPATGVHRIHVKDLHADETMCLNAVVVEPYKGEEVLDGYRIGRYETVPLRGLETYRVPEGFVRLTPEVLDLFVSPHFQLRQFVCKQASDFPKFLRIRTRMLLKLEMLLEEVNEAGHDADTFAVLSGYRTPWYNRTIGNRTKYTRHAYGDAADVYVDRDGDGWMDDLTGDGRATRADARVLYDLVEDATEETWYQPLVGGLGLYGAKPHRGPFIHVDTRGYRARW